MIKNEEKSTLSLSKSDFEKMSEDIEKYGEIFIFYMPVRELPIKSNELIQETFDDLESLVKKIEDENRIRVYHFTKEQFEKLKKDIQLGLIELIEE